jgi:hypothetical protein
MKLRKLLGHLNFQAHMLRLGLINQYLILLTTCKNWFFSYWFFRKNGQKTFTLLVCAMDVQYADSLYKWGRVFCRLQNYIFSSILPKLMYKFVCKASCASRELLYVLFIIWCLLSAPLCDYGWWMWPLVNVYILYFASK